MYADIPIKIYNMGQILGNTDAVGEKSGFINCIYCILKGIWDSKTAIELLSIPVTSGIATHIINFFISLTDIINIFTFLIIIKYKSLSF